MYGIARKYEKMPKDIEWHFIGHLQTNKVKYIAPFTDDTNQINEEFRMLKNIFLGLKRDYFGDSRFFTEISMGMSDDYRITMEGRRKHPGAHRKPRLC